MCLISKSQFPEKADGRIECYKVLSFGNRVQSWFERNILRRSPIYYSTPYLRTDVTRYVINRDTFVAKGDKDVEIGTYDVIVSSGYVHSYQTFEIAKRHSGVGECVVKCYIPDGCMYYTGDNDYCSDALEFGDVVYRYGDKARSKWKAPQRPNKRRNSMNKKKKHKK